jgi:hypothetical protein
VACAGDTPNAANLSSGSGQAISEGAGEKAEGTSLAILGHISKAIMQGAWQATKWFLAFHIQICYKNFENRLRFHPIEGINLPNCLTKSPMGIDGP